MTSKKLGYGVVKTPDFVISGDLDKAVEYVKQVYGEPNA